MSDDYYMSECPVCCEQIKGKYYGCGVAHRSCHHGHYEGGGDINSSYATIEGKEFRGGENNPLRNEAVMEARKKWFENKTEPFEQRFEVLFRVKIKFPEHMPMVSSDIKEAVSNLLYDREKQERKFPLGETFLPVVKKLIEESKK